MRWAIPDSGSWAGYEWARIGLRSWEAWKVGMKPHRTFKTEAGAWRWIVRHEAAARREEVGRG